MHERLMKRVEFVANILIIGVAVLACVVLLRSLVWGGTALPEKATTGARRAAAPASPGVPLAVGRRISLPGIDWAAHEQTVVLVLSTQCHYCTESAPFYRRLLSEIRKRGSKRAAVAMLPQAPADAARYLSSLGLAVDSIVHAPPSALGLSGTPSVLVINSQGIVQRVWLGRLPEKKENDVLGYL
jgi:peroxiredoxin